MKFPDHPFFLATQFHPEFRSRPTRPSPPFIGFVNACLPEGQGGEVLKMVHAERFIEEAVEEIATEAGGHRVVIALSGGVDTSVCAALASRAIGDRLVPIYVDTGLMRKGETDRIAQMFGHLDLQVVHAERRVPRRTRRDHRPGGEAEGDRRAVHPGLRARGKKDRRDLPPPGDDLPRPDRERGRDQKPPQCRRHARPSTRSRQ